MVEMISQLPFTLYVAWYPGNVVGAAIAERLHQHFGSDRYRYIVGGAGVSVLFRSTTAPGYATPIPIVWDDADATAVVLLVDEMLASDPDWVRYIHTLVDDAESKGLGARVFPVTMATGVLDIGLEVQALRWDHWVGSDEEKEQRLLREIICEFSRMLRHQLGKLEHPDSPDSLEGYLKNVRVFLSHSKHDEHGITVAKAVRDWLHDNSLLSSFLDVYDIPAGLPFTAVMDHNILIGVLLAIWTDSYSSRQWCRHEVIEAKRNNTPMLVVDCLEAVDERALPYLGNVPVIRMNPNRRDRIEQVVGLLLDEVFKDFLWRCRVERLRQSHPHVSFMARPPEMISLSSLPHGTVEHRQTIVYPDPPLSTEESSLLLDVVPSLQMYSLMQWQGGAQHDAN